MKRNGMHAMVFAAALVVFTGLLGAAYPARQAFITPQAAMEAFGAAVATSDEDALKDLLGEDFRSLIPPAGAEARYRFLQAWAQSRAVQPEGRFKARIAVGNDGWTLPIPLVRTAEGWRFDTGAGAEEMRLRRIGRNERAVMQVMLAIYDAQKDYALKDRNGDGVLQYAPRFASSPGRHDGLFWPAKGGEDPSPLGPAVAQAQAAGGGRGGEYFGYRYKMLTAQGEQAPGGALDYRVAGRMIGGFAALAWPAEYGETGVMSFMVSHEGVVYEKDLGPNTAARAREIRRFDPGAGWRKAEDH
jgi:hypothetical protein